MPRGIAGSRHVAHLGIDRSAIVRLAPIHDALHDLGIAQVSARAGPWRAGQPPRTVAASPSLGALERELDAARPAVVFSAGDGDRAVEAALLVVAREVPLVRVGAGLRSNDPTDRTDTNRIVLDELADVLLADGEEAAARLRDEGFPEERIAVVGSTIPDSISRWRATAMRRQHPAWADVAGEPYVLAALRNARGAHDRERLLRIFEGLRILAGRRSVVLCLPDSVRLDQCLVDALADVRATGATIVGELEYLDFLSLEVSAAAVLTDAGAVQEETTMLGVPCFTLARASARTLTLTHGTNSVLGDDSRDIADIVIEACELEPIPLWDGSAGRRIAAWLREWS